MTTIHKVMQYPAGFLSVSEANIANLPAYSCRSSDRANLIPVEKLTAFFRANPK
jgi:hypothetical protein